MNLPNKTPQRAFENFKLHNLASPLLLGQIKADDTIVQGAQKSFLAKGSKKNKIFKGADELHIRQEQPNDYELVYQVIKKAFEQAEHKDGSEQDLVAALRKSKSFIPELSLVAVEDSKIVGHILFTKAFVNQTEVLALAPLAVLPEYQHRGIGRSLIKQGHMIAYTLGYGYSIVLGHPEYYPKAGYVPASRYGIRAPFETKDENFMAICLREHSKPPHGIITYDPAFEI